MNLGIISAITQKDVRDAIRHRYLLTALVTPLFVAVLFRLLLPGVNGQSILTIVVHDVGKSALVSQLRKIPQITLVDIESADAIVSEVQKRKAIGGLEVPANFDADLAAGKQPELTVYLNNKRSTFEQGAFRRVLDQRVRSVARQPEPAVVVWVDIDKDVTDQNTSGITLDQIMLPLLLILALGMTGAFVVPLLIVEEKEKRTIDFLLSSPASLTEIITGKAATGAVYTVLIAGLLLVFNRHLIKSWSLMILTVVLGLLFVVAVGLLTGSLLKN
ncbi:MAG TPA: ABC transporter permease, partial [Pyrinomonadaceae bacterium]